MNSVLSVLLTTVVLKLVLANRQNVTFPKDFKFGVASSSYQIEGGWNTDGKGESIWDHLVHNRPKLVIDGTNGDISCDSYHQYKQDVQMLRLLGVDFYRFSISWPRILPTGYSNKINQKGIAYYNNLIDELLLYNITPYVTLYHWDLPQKFQELGGWTNQYLIDRFVDYARVAFNAFGDRVKVWQTFNEIRQICYDGYSTIFAPYLNMTGIADYLCIHTTLLAHAKVYHMYDTEYRKRQKGRIGMSISSFWYRPATNSSEDINAAHLSNLFETALIADPIFSPSGDYPEEVKKRIADKSSEQLLGRSRLPVFTPEQINYIKGTADFYGLNHYTTYLTKKRKTEMNLRKPSLIDDIGSYTYADPEWESCISSWLKVVPEGFREFLNWLKNRYGNPEILIFENGYSDDGSLNDIARIKYLRLYLESVFNAINDGCNVTHYTAWSFLDNFEWLSGYSERFGLIHIDFNHPNRTRTPKASALVYKEIIRTKQVDWNNNPVVKNSSWKKSVHQTLLYLPVLYCLLFMTNSYLVDKPSE